MGRNQRENIGTQGNTYNSNSKESNSKLGELNLKYYVVVINCIMYDVNYTFSF